MRQKIIKKLDRVFSEYVRVKHSDGNGYCSCITCDKKFHYKNIDAGHFVSRRHILTRYDEMNVFPQCKYCNRFLNGLQYEYGKALDSRFGKGTADKIIAKSKANERLETEKLNEMFAFYKKNLITLYN
jgi:NAD-dependent SIR2 family protein deacetylase|tara:strand:- start:7525 stop:7908 length:384 start_codon:yes stop_codon:yes gene_type:complete